MDYVLQTNGLCKEYRAGKVLNELTMRVPKGSIYGLVGKNGAGKTTLIRIICGLQQPSAGTFTLYQAEFGTPGISSARRRMGAVVETPSLYTDMTAAQNLKLQNRVLGLPDDSNVPGLLRLAGLEHAGAKKVRHFSLGMRQRLGIAVALCGSPDFLVLDEPVNGLDPQGIIDVRELILKLNREHQVTVLISSHILGELSRLATFYGFLDGGRMVREISASELERAERKCMRVTVSDVRVLIRVLDRSGAEYHIQSDTQADIFGKPNLTRLTMALAQENCELLDVREQDESLESYYLSLIGGERHE